jgi:hypothetical protein
MTPRTKSLLFAISSRNLFYHRILLYILSSSHLCPVLRCEQRCDDWMDVTFAVITIEHCGQDFLQLWWNMTKVILGKINRMARRMKWWQVVISISQHDDRHLFHEKMEFPSMVKVAKRTVRYSSNLQNTVHWDPRYIFTTLRSSAGICVVAELQEHKGRISLYYIKKSCAFYFFHSFKFFGANGAYKGISDDRGGRLDETCKA